MEDDAPAVKAQNYMAKGEVSEQHKKFQDASFSFVMAAENYNKAAKVVTDLEAKQMLQILARAAQNKAESCRHRARHIAALSAEIAKADRAAAVGPGRNRSISAPVKPIFRPRQPASPDQPLSQGWGRRGAKAENKGGAKQGSAGRRLSASVQLQTPEDRKASAKEGLLSAKEALEQAMREFHELRSKVPKVPTRWSRQDSSVKPMRMDGSFFLVPQTKLDTPPAPATPLPGLPDTIHEGDEEEEEDHLARSDGGLPVHHTRALDTGTKRTVHRPTTPSSASPDPSQLLRATEELRLMKRALYDERDKLATDIQGFNNEFQTKFQAVRKAMLTFQRRYTDAHWGELDYAHLEQPSTRSSPSTPRGGSPEALKLSTASLRSETGMTSSCDESSESFRKLKSVAAKLRTKLVHALQTNAKLVEQVKSHRKAMRMCGCGLCSAELNAKAVVATPQPRKHRSKAKGGQAVIAGDKVARNRMVMQLSGRARGSHGGGEASPRPPVPHSKPQGRDVVLERKARSNLFINAQQASQKAAAAAGSMRSSSTTASSSSSSLSPRVTAEPDPYASLGNAGESSEVHAPVSSTLLGSRLGFAAGRNIGMANSVSNFLTLSRMGHGESSEGGTCEGSQLNCPAWAASPTPSPSPTPSTSSSRGAPQGWGRGPKHSRHSRGSPTPRAIRRPRHPEPLTVSPYSVVSPPGGSQSPRPPLNPTKSSQSPQIDPDTVILDEDQSDGSADALSPSVANTSVNLLSISSLGNLLGSLSFSYGTDGQAM